MAGSDVSRPYKPLSDSVEATWGGASQLGVMPWCRKHHAYAKSDKGVVAQMVMSAMQLYGWCRSEIACRGGTRRLNNVFNLSEEWRLLIKNQGQMCSWLLIGSGQPACTPPGFRWGTSSVIRHTHCDAL